MTETKTTQDGVMLTKLEITAASPDVIGKLMKEIAERTLAMIPEGTIEKIAQEVLAGKSVIYSQRSSYGSDTVTWVYSDEMKKMITAELQRRMAAEMTKVMERHDVQKAIEELTLLGVQSVLQNLPEMTAKVYSQTLKEHFKKPWNDRIDWNDPVIKATAEMQQVIQRIVSALNSHSITV